MGENTKKREEGKVEKKEEVKKEIPYNAVTGILIIFYESMANLCRSATQFVFTG